MVVAAGMQSSYFGHDEFAEYAPCLKTITDAETIRSKILSAYELAESTDDEDERRRQMTFVLVGAGPTGVELAASMAQMATTTLRRNFRRIDPATTTIILLDGAKRILPSFAESLSKKAAERLAKLGVQVITGAMVESIDDSRRHRWRKADPVRRRLVDGGRFALAPREDAWRRDRPGGASLRWPVPERSGCSECIRGRRYGDADAKRQAAAGRGAGRDPAGPLCRTIDLERAQRPKAASPVPVLRQGQHGRRRQEFRHHGNGPHKTGGFTAWFAWAFIHLLFLPQLQNRLRVERQWLWSYFTGQRSSRLVTEAPRIGK